MSSRHLFFAVWVNETYFFAHIGGLNLNVSFGHSKGVFYLTSSQGDSRRLAAPERIRFVDMLYYSSAYPISAAHNFLSEYDFQ